MLHILISILYKSRQTFTKPVTYRALYWSISLCLWVCIQQKTAYFYINISVDGVKL